MFTLPDLPFAYDALQPTISDDTLHFHHDKHHATYVKTLNELLGAKAGSAVTLEQVIRDAVTSGDKKIFNNAAQAWNHGFLWDCMTPRSEDPPAALTQAIATAFGDLATLKKTLVSEGA